MYPIHAGLIGCTMLMLWSHKYKVGHIDLILIKHQNLLNSPEIPEFSYVSYDPGHHCLSGYSNYPACMIT